MLYNYKRPDLVTQQITRCNASQGLVTLAKADIYPQILSLRYTITHTIMPRRQRSEMWKIRKAARKAAAKNRSKHLSEVVSRATLKAKSEAISSPACHFLRIPLGECSVSFMCR